jgi:hypothetical protein
MPSPQYRHSALTPSHDDDPHPDSPLLLRELPETLPEHYGLSAQQVELEQSILYISEETSLPLAGPFPNAIQTYRDFTLDLLNHSKKSGNFDDVDTAINRLRKISLKISRNLPEVAKIPQYEVTTFTIEMLAVKVKVDAGNALDDIDEIEALCRKLFTSKAPPPPQGHLTNAFEALTRAVLDEFSRGK